jgi:hypothetical protein
MPSKISPQFPRLTKLSRRMAVEHRATFGQPMICNGAVRFPVILSGGTARMGCIGRAPVDRGYEGLKRATLDNRKRVGSGNAAFARHEGAWRMLRQRCRDSDLVEAWRHSNEMRARGYVPGYHGCWVSVR